MHNRQFVLVQNVSNNEFLVTAAHLSILCKITFQRFQEFQVEIITHPLNTKDTVISGGILLKNVVWKHYPTTHTKNVYVTNVKEFVKDSKASTPVPGLQINGKRRTRARYPNLPGGIEVSPMYDNMISGGDATWTPPDFNKYGNYFDYFYTLAYGQTGLESGISYYWFVTRFFNLLKEPLLYSENNLESIKSASIQMANLFLFLIGLLGIHFLLKKTQNFKIENTLPILIILSIFPPLIGARMILKPEILVFCLLPWLLLFYFEYFNKKKSVYLLVSVPIVATLFSLKASITFILSLFLLITFNKNIFDKKFILYNLLSLILFSLIINENFVLNGNYLWEHVAPESYSTKAKIEYIYNLSINELWTNPYRDNLKNSMISILLTDTFGDYWQRYWFHYDGWGIKIEGNTKSKNFPGSLGVVKISILLSVIFYSSSIYYLFKEKNKIYFILESQGLLDF